MTLLLNTINGVERDNGQLMIFGLVHTTGQTLEELFDNATIEVSVNGKPQINHISDLPAPLQVLLRNDIKYRFLEGKDEILN